MFDTQRVIDKFWATEVIASHTGVLSGHFPKHRLHRGTGTGLTVPRSVHCGTDHTEHKHTEYTHTPTRCLVLLKRKEYKVMLQAKGNV